MKPSYISSLTPLRGVAAIMVLIYHFHLFIFPLHDNSSYALISKWYLLVDLFFVLSGFVLLHVYGNFFRNGWGSEDFKRYIWARFARIYPLHFVTLLYAVFLFYLMASSGVEFRPVEKEVFNVGAIPTNLLLIQAWGMHPEATFNTPSWSISVEWFIYLLFPFLVMLMFLRRKWGKLFLAFIAVGGLVLIMYIWFPYNIAVRRTYLPPAPEGLLENMYSINVITGPALLRGICGFIIGMFAYQLYQSKLNLRILTSTVVWFLLWILLFVSWTWALLPDFLAVMIFGVIILGAARNAGFLKRLLNVRVLRYLGDISYSVYLTHVLIIFSFMVYGRINGVAEEESMPSYAMRWAIMIVFMLMTVGISSVTYYLIEKPARKFLNSWIRPTSPRGEIAR